jgi:hypothetical protein
MKSPFPSDAVLLVVLTSDTIKSFPNLLMSETTEHGVPIMRCGCDYGQGYDRLGVQWCMLQIGEKRLCIQLLGRISNLD